jgi:hypothetical protein
MRDKKSICMYTWLHVTPAIVEVRKHVQPELCGSGPPSWFGERKSSELPGNWRSPGVDLRVELAQVLNVPGVRDLATLGEL